MDHVDSYARPRSRRIVYDSDDEEVHVDDDEDEEDRRLYRSKHSVPPPPPPPIGPPPIRHLPSAIEDAQSTYQQIELNIYRGANTGNSPVDDCLPCQCKYNPSRDPRWKACGPDCINRNLLVECIEDDCPCGSYCLNRRFQMKQNADVDVVKTEKKGFGLRAMEGLPAGSFVMEYIGEVLPHASFVKRTREYSLAGVEHFYFMSLQSDEVIDATKKGCLARFINHSCNPNCHLEKWVVGSKLRIGIFTIKRIAEGEELTFDYQFERYGAEAQKCYCGEFNCSGFIGGNKRSSATRLDDYNHLDEVEDEDEIDLENQISMRHPKKDKNHDGDYEEMYEEPRVTRGIEDPILMEKLARIMFMKPKVEKSKRLLAKLMATTERACLRRFLVLHGLVILKAWLKHYKDEPDIIMGIMFVLPNIPLLSRNAIEDSQIEEAIQEVADGPECPSKGMALEVLEQWKELKPTYRIPKAKKQVHRDLSPGAPPPRRELSPSPATQQDIWSKEKSRPASPAKEGAAQQPDSGIPTLDDASKALPVGPRVPETFPEQVVISGQVPASVPAPATTPASTPPPPKPVNIDGFTQEQLQEVIGRAYDKQKQKNLANGSGSAGASLSASVVKTMAKYKAKLGSSEAFKKHARRITHLIADKEMRSKTFKAGEVTEVTQGMKNKMRRFIKEYMTKLFKKLPKEERSSSNSAPASLSNGSKLTQSHVPEQEFDGLPAVYHGSVVPSKGQESTAGKKHIKAGGDKKSMGYGDVEVDDDDDVKYGEGEDGDEDEGDLEGEEDDDGGVAAVPSASVELPL
ncbi:MAG: hypothetical protein J3R72DRAFT_362958 [Linnemannia gamsii]|nr:MAG: hypothetical protein J3R72DRAFT_362958 [Linnemannia gamsii]